MSAPTQQGRALNFQAQSDAQYDAMVLLLDNVTRSVGYGGAGGGGKSIVGVAWCWLMCNLYAGVRYFFGRNELSQLKKTTLVSYYEFCELYNIPHGQRGTYDGQANILRFANGSEILMLNLAYKPSDPLGTRFGGLLLTGGFCDESGECDFGYIDVLYSRIGRWKNEDYSILPKILEAFNPDKGHIYRRFYKPYRDGTETTEVRFIRALVVDRLKHPDYFHEHRALHPDDVGTNAGIYVDNLLRRSPQLQERLLYGNFDYDDDPSSLIDFDAIEDFFDSRHLTPDRTNKYLTADIAGMGSDLFVVGVWYGWVLVDIVSMEKSGGREVLDLILSKMREHGIAERHVSFDADGIGSPFGGQGGFLPGAKTFHNGARPLKIGGVTENYTNLKTQCAYHLAAAIQESRVSCHVALKPAVRERITEELGQIKRANMNADGKLAIKRKKDIKRDIGRSPDYTDMLLIRWIFEGSHQKQLQYL